MTQYLMRLTCGFLAAVFLLWGSHASAQDRSKSGLFAMYQSPPTMTHLHCPGSLSKTVCRELASEILFAKETLELKPTHVAPDMTDLALQAALRNCSEVSSRFGVADKMYGTDPVHPQGPFKLFDLAFHAGEEDASRGPFLIIAKGYRREGADRDLGWSSYYIISPEEPCSPTAVELIQRDENLGLVETLIQHKDETYLLTLLQQERQGRYYSGRVTRLGPDGAEDLIGVAIEF